MKNIPKFPNNQAIMDKYIHYMELQNLKKATQKNKAWGILVLCRFHNNKKLEKITKKDIENFYIAMKRKAECNEITFSTFQKYIIELRVFFDWLKPDNDFFKDLKIPSIQKDTSEQDYISADDIKKMMSFTIDTRDRALVMLLWNCALRVGELTNIKVGNVDLEKEEITVSGKTGIRKYTNNNSFT